MNLAKLLMITGSLLSAFATNGLAGGVADFANKTFTSKDLEKALLPCNKRGACCDAGNCRNVFMKVETGPTGVNLDVTFELNSDVLSRQSKEVLDKLGEALTSPHLIDAEYLIEGHTDATGSLSHNMDLSKRRADSVRRYLVRTYRIDPDRLHTEGRGPTALADKANPASGRNRRVVVRPDEYIWNDDLSAATPQYTDSIENKAPQQVKAAESLSRRQMVPADNSNEYPRVREGFSAGRR